MGIISIIQEKKLFGILILSKDKQFRKATCAYKNQWR